MKLTKRRQGFRTHLPPAGDYDEPMPEFLFGATTDPTIEDSWPVEYKNDDGSYGFYGAVIGCSMSFTAKRGGVLDRAKVWMKHNNPTVFYDLPITAAIYDTSATLEYARPEGVALAVSEPVMASTLNPAPYTEPVEFFFTGANQLQFVKDKVYCLAFEIPDGQLSPSDNFRFGFNMFIRPPKHGGDYSQLFSGGTWNSMGVYNDLIFYVYSLP